MGKMIDQKPSHEGEAVVWECFRQNLPRNYIVYNTRSVNTWEYDFCIMAENKGLFVVEVKGWNPDFIVSVNNSRKVMLADGKICTNPLNQARRYRFDLINYFNRKLGINPLVMHFVCYPFLSEDDYKAKRLDALSDPKETLFKEDLENVALLGSILK